MNDPAPNTLAGLPHPGQDDDHSRQLWANTATRGDANAGLLFQRFFHGHAKDFVEPLKPARNFRGGKDVFVRALLATWARTAPQRKALSNDYASRMAKVATEQTRLVLGDEAPKAARAFEAQGRWLTGTGNSHPMEVGLTFHHTLGVPYLCGAGIKGLVLAWLKRASQEGATSEGFTRFEHLFGTSGQAGELVFFDAIPVATPVALLPDVMTPHYTGWYQWDEENAKEIEEGKAVPADWHSPVPVPFLTVGDGMQLQFAIAPSLRLRRDSTAETQQALREDLARVWDWLEGALYWYGAGAKTATGYGRFAAQGT